MSVYPKIYSKCLSREENRSFSYLVTNENAVIVCGVTTKGKIVTLERLGAAYCLKLYCLTTNCLKWERIIQKDMRVVQYANINIFIINDQKHAFEFVDRDESLKLYEKIRGCIKKLIASTAANPTNQSRSELSNLKQKPVRPPPSYRASIKTTIQTADVLTVSSPVVNDLIDISDANKSTTASSSANAIPSRSVPRIRYPEESSRNALPSDASPNTSSSPLRNERRPLPRSPVAQNRTLSVNLNPTIENTRIPIPSPRRINLGTSNTPITRSPILGESSPVTQDIGIPIVSSSSGLPRNTSIQNLLSRQNSNENGNVSSTSNGSVSVASPVVHRRVRNIIPNGSESGSTMNIITPVINGRDTGRNIHTNVTTGSIITSTNSIYDTRSPSTPVSINLTSSNQAAQTTVVTSYMPSDQLPQSSTTLSEDTSNVLASVNNGINVNIHTQTSTTNTSTSTNVVSSVPGYPISSPNVTIPLVNHSTGNSTNSPVRSRGILLQESNYLPAPVELESNPVQSPRRRVKLANAANRLKTKSAFIQSPSVVTDVFVHVKSRLFGKGEEKTTPKCMVIGKPTDVTHQVHLDSLDFRNMQLQDNQLKGLIKSKSMEHIPSLDTNLTVFDANDDGPCCVICLTDPPTHVIVPCGHKILCEACVQQNVLSKLRRKWCMTCNGVIREIIKVYE